MIRRALGAALALFVLAGAPAFADPAPQREPARWAQDVLGRPADPDVRFGTLPNGLRYAVMRNTTPADGVAMRLRIGSGSLKERDEEQGLAHYLEHMAFRGSRNIADGDVVKMLERQGLRFGPDTNAFTAHDQTVYMFTFPRADATALDTGFTLFREIGERLTLDANAVEAERGVILSEERLRDSPSFRAIKASFANSLAGTRVPQRWPIGLAETIKGANPARLRRYYEANYRPDNATLVVVGAIDPVAVEAAIKARFADWKPAAGADAVDIGTPHPASDAVEFIAAGAPDNLRLGWVRPADRRGETVAYDREKLADLVAMTILNNRLADRAAAAGSPFVAAQGQALSSLYGAASLTFVQLTAAPERWNEALAAMIAEQRHLMIEGPDQADIARAVRQVSTQLESIAANAATRKSSEIADAIISTVNDGLLYTSPEQDLALARQILPPIGMADVRTALTRVFSGAGPLLFRSAQSGPVGEATLAEALRKDWTAPLAARMVSAAVTWPYTSFGTPGTVIGREDDAALGTTTVRFANGSRLMVRPTKIEADHISVKVALGNGRAGADPALIHALWAVSLTPLGGTGKLAAGEIQRWAQTTGRSLTVDLRPETRFFVMGGQTRPADFATQMQLLAAEARDAAFRPEMAEKLAAIAPMITGQVDASAGAVYTRALHTLIGSGDTRYADVPAAADIAATRPADIPALLKGALTGPADVVVVGDVTIDAAIAAMATTFGAGPALPPRAEVTPQIAPPAPSPVPHVAWHTGRADQAYYGVYWLLPDYFADPRGSHVARVAAGVLQARLIETVREKLGLTYTPQTDVAASVQITGLGYLGAILETPPANFPAFRTALAALIADLAARPISADELDRARKPLVEGRAKDMEGNGFWSTWLPLVLRDPRVRAQVLESGPGMASVNAGEVQALFARLAARPAPVTVVAEAHQP